MNKHILLDKLTAGIGAAIAGKKKFFSANLHSPSFRELIESLTIKLPGIDSEGVYEIKAESPYGIYDAAFKVEKWLGEDYPVIIYHHGNNERPFDYGSTAKNTFYNIFVKAREQFNANLIVVRAPFHNLPLKQYQEKVTDMKNFMAMISVSVKMNEELITLLGHKNNNKTISCGISLGGWVTNLHRANFNTSAAYVPLLAGTFLGELFISSKYRSMTAAEALKHPESLRSSLNFNQDFEKVTEKNLFPLLARYDQFIEYPVQQKSYQGHAIATIDNGHVTAAVNASAMRGHILKVMNNLF